MKRINCKLKRYKQITESVYDKTCAICDREETSWQCRIRKRLVKLYGSKFCQHCCITCVYAVKWTMSRSGYTTPYYDNCPERRRFEKIEDVNNI